MKLELKQAKVIRDHKGSERQYTVGEQVLWSPEIDLPDWLEYESADPGKVLNLQPESVE